MVTGIPLLIIIFLAIAFIVISSSYWKLHPFVGLLLASFGVGLAVGVPLPEVIVSVNKGFGGLMGYIGLIVVFGSIIGVILERSGAAMKIADLVLNLVGKKRPALAMSIIGATVSIPVFCDSGFIILSGLNNALAKRSKAKKATLALALASGLYTTHTLIPPTPGPIAAAGNIGAGDYIGMIMLLGFLVAIPTAVAGYLFSIKKGATIAVESIEPHGMHGPDLPLALRSIMPIVVPILLIASASIVNLLQLTGLWVEWLRFFGHPLVALLIGLLISFSLFKKMDQEHLTGWVGEGIKLAGPILVITGAGGAFGGVLKATPIAEMVGGWVAEGQFSGSAFLVIAFLIAALLKTSQGSSTNALVIASSMLAPLVATLGFESPFEMALIVMAIGGGAMTVSHANDSYFWVVSQFSGISMKDAYRSFTLMTGLQGFMVLLMTLILYWLF